MVTLGGGCVTKIGGISGVGGINNGYRMEDRGGRMKIGMGGGAVVVMGKDVCTLEYGCTVGVSTVGVAGTDVENILISFLMAEIFASPIGARWDAGEGM